MPMPKKPDGHKAVRTSITLPPSVMAELKKMLQPGESLSALIGRIVEEHLQKR